MNKRMAALIVALGVLMAVYQIRAVYSTCMESCYADHLSIVNGTALEPFRYRVLTPWLMEGITRGLHGR